MRRVTAIRVCKSAYFWHASNYVGSQTRIDFNFSRKVKNLMKLEVLLLDEVSMLP